MLFRTYQVSKLYYWQLASFPIVSMAAVLLVFPCTMLRDKHGLGVSQPYIVENNTRNTAIAMTTPIPDLACLGLS